jgi:hypothetical protein
LGLGTWDFCSYNVFPPVSTAGTVMIPRSR